MDHSLESEQWDYSRAVGSLTEYDSAIAKLLEAGGKYTKCVAYCVLTSSFRKPGSLVSENQYRQVIVKELARRSTFGPQYITVCEILSLTKGENLLVAQLHILMHIIHQSNSRQHSICLKWLSFSFNYVLYSYRACQYLFHIHEYQPSLLCCNSHIIYACGVVATLVSSAPFWGLFKLDLFMPDCFYVPAISSKNSIWAMCSSNNTRNAYFPYCTATTWVFVLGMQDMAIPLRHSASALTRPREIALRSCIQELCNPIYARGYMYTPDELSLGTNPGTTPGHTIAAKNGLLSNHEVGRGMLVYVNTSLTLMFSNSLSVRTLVDWLTMVSRDEWACSKESVLPRESHWRQRSTKFLWNQDKFVKHSRGTRTQHYKSLFWI